MAQDEGSRRIFDFSDQRAADGWFVVNDGVMGGVSSSRFESTDEGVAVFEGVLSTSQLISIPIFFVGLALFLIRKPADDLYAQA